MLHRCFSTPVWHFQFGNAINNQVLMDAVHQLRDEDQQGTEVSNVGGWQSTSYIHKRGPFDQLAAFVVQKAAEASREWGLNFHGHAPEINTMWANINRGGDYNFRHHHWGFPIQNFNFLSGSYYIRCTPDHGAIKFVDERPSSKFAILAPFIEQHTEYTSDQFSISPQSGDLVLFPSWIEHFVSKGTDTSERIGVAFNLHLPKALTDQIYLRDRH